MSFLEVGNILLSEGGKTLVCAALGQKIRRSPRSPLCGAALFLNQNHCQIIEADVLFHM